MKTQQITEILKRSPRPHFLIPETVVTSADGKKITGQVLFSAKGDVSIRDRGHVNVIHCMAAVWNLSHISTHLVFAGVSKKLRARETWSKAIAPVPLETKIDVFYEVTKLTTSGKLTRGKMNTKFYLKEKLLHRVIVDFIVI